MKKILFIQPGPCHKIINPKIKEISNYFTGTIITTSSSDEIARSKESSGFAFYCLKTEYKTLSAIRLVKFLAHVIKFCFNAKKTGDSYDLVVTYDPLKTGIIGVLASRILNCKFAPEINGTYHSKFNFYDKSLKFAWIYAFIYKQIMKVVFTFADGIKYQYPEQISFFSKNIKKRVVSAFPNLVQLDAFRNVGEEKIILIVGFPFWRKGIDIGIEAFKLIAGKYPDWKLKILGWYPDKSLLEKHIANHPQIFHHKPVMPAEMPAHVGSCAIVCCPSRSEGVPRVIMEAMKAEKPVIGANVDGIPVVIKDGVNGLLFDNEDFKQLAVKLEILISNPALRKTMGQNGLEIVLKEFGREQYTSKLVSLYNRIIG